MSTHTRVFVYGTLKTGHGNNRLLSQSTRLGRELITGPFRLISLGGFPGLVATPKDAGTAPVLGEVYTIDEATLASLDMLEGHPRFYKRAKIKTSHGPAWAYFLPDEYLTSARYPIVDTVWRPDDEETQLVYDRLSAGI